ncbi:MAG: nitroreductase family protein [Deltaproteobacteria bacterium]|nr:nitroreductase family protein [Deltaproteobacteria bacterium]
MMKSDNDRTELSVLDSIIAKIDSCTATTDNEIRDEELATLIKAARLAPSADNSQIWRFLIIKRKEKIDKIITIAGLSKKNFKTIILALAAPFIIKHIRREQPFYAIDVPIAITHILLQGLELGIKTEIHFIFERTDILNTLNIPSKYKPVAILGLNKYENT